MANGRYEMVRIVIIHGYDDSYRCMRLLREDMNKKLKEEVKFYKQ